MNTNELLNFMENDSYIHSMMGDVVAKDLLPKPTNSPTLFIVNLDKSNKEGSHWIALLLSNKYINEYFDPLGNKPDLFFRQYFNRYSIACLVNTKKCQSSVTSSCGKFCLLYCYLRSRGKSLAEILTLFSYNTVYNELFVNNFYNTVTSNNHNKS